MGQFKSHLIALVSLGVLLHDRDDALRLLVRQAVNLTDQVVSLFHRQWLRLEILGRLGLGLGWLARGSIGRLGGVLGSVGLLSCIGFLGSGRRFLLVDQFLHLLLQSSDLLLFALELGDHFVFVVGVHGGCPVDCTDLTEDRFVLKVRIIDQIVGLVDGLKEDRVELVLLLAELHCVVYCVLDLTYHVLGTLVLEIFQAHLYCVKRID